MSLLDLGNPHIMGGRQGVVEKPEEVLSTPWTSSSEKAFHELSKSLLQAYGQVLAQPLTCRKHAETLNIKGLEFLLDKAL